MTHETHARIAALVAAGFLLTSGGAAFADTATSGNSSTGSGNRATTDTDESANVCGNPEAVLGVAGAQCEGDEADHSPEPEDEDHVTEGPEDDGEDLGEDPDGGETPAPEEGGSEEPTDPPVKVPEDDGEEPGDQEKPSAPGVPVGPEAPADESRVGGGEDVTPEETSPGGLADTGMERAPLVALVIGGVVAVVAGIGLILGLRRRAGA